MDSVIADFIIYIFIHYAKFSRVLYNCSVRLFMIIFPFHIILNAHTSFSAEVFEISTNDITSFSLGVIEIFLFICTKPLVTQRLQNFN